MHDRYDIGFGLFFEWSKSPTEQVSVHISDSEEEDEEDEHDNGKLARFYLAEKKYFENF
jgi:hypothetical protein